jgi:hypothetical protein
MTEASRFERRVAALLASYADRAPTDVDALAMIRLVAAGPRPRALVGGWPRSRGLALALLVMTLLITIASATLIAGGQLFKRAPEQMLTDGVLADAPPSTPETGELVLAYDGRPANADRPWPGVFTPVHQVWVYADGRVISRREGGPYGVDGTATGFLEQRLRPDAVELLRRDFVRTGLFDGDRTFLGSSALAWGWIAVRNGERLATLRWCWVVPCPGDVSALWPEQMEQVIIRLVAQLTDPTASLPATAWDVSEVRTYVPSRYAICFWRGQAYARSIEPAIVLSSPPGAAQDLLRGKDKTYHYVPVPTIDPRPTVCAELSDEDSRELVGLLGRAGFERDIPGGATGSGVVSPGEAGVRFFTAQYRLQAPDPIGTGQISFEPVLPHGQWEAMGG